MIKLPRTADSLSDDARRALTDLAETFPKYRLHKIEFDLSFPLLARIMRVAFARYKFHGGTPIALCQTLFPASPSHIDSVLSALNFEANQVLEALEKIKMPGSDPQRQLKVSTYKEDYLMLRDIEAFLKPLARRSYDPWDPNDP